jgi:predicted AAA+ superfamily ATPase
MHPLSLVERGLAAPTVRLADLLTGNCPDIEGRSAVDAATYAREIVVSGFPGIRALPDRARRAQLDGYLARVVDRDFDEAGHKVRRPDALRRWMRSYAAATATVTEFEKIRSASTSGEGDTLAKSSVIAYRDVLERLYLLDSLPGWLPSRNHLARLAQAPRHHLADPALAARLLGINEAALLQGVVSPLFDATMNPNAPLLRKVAPRDGTLFGQLFESLVAQSVRVYAQATEATVHHLRTKEGRHEVDLIVQRDDQRIVALEVKLGPVVDTRDVQHLLWLRDTLGADLLDAAVITTGPQAYRRPDGIAVIPAVLLGP